MYRVICVIVLFLYADGSSIKGLYCKDPDTGKLYPVNSTWQSESFCGNYTCKLRKKNITQTEYTPIKKINLTSDKLRKHQIFDDMSLSPSQKSYKNVKNIEDKQQPVYHKDLMSTVNEITTQNKSGEDDKDRYLTESEIKRITEILHTVKKSDLEAIVEIYSLAQDIYKEMSTTTGEPEKETKNSNEHKKEFRTKLKSNSQESVSYWYEPLHHHNTKVKPADSKNEETYPSPTVRSYPHPSSYFKSPIADKDFGKLPYYYPLSNFQRMSSYIHGKSPFSLPSPTQPQPIEHRPCNKQSKNVVAQTLFSQPITQRKMSESIRPRDIQPMQAVLLPYPFSYVNHYNFSSHPASYYYNNYPWAHLDLFNKYKNNPNNINHGNFLSEMPKTEVIVNNEELEERNQDFLNIAEDKTESAENDGNKILPDWQTDQLSTNILEEVKANILEKSKLLKPLSFRKNIKLEKVGKVIKLDELSRSKREIANEQKVIDDSENAQLEAYIERKTCESSTEPGFFSVGNESQPFPACCPRRIAV